MRVAILCTAVFLATAGAAAAQPGESRTSVTAITGVAKTYDDEGSLGRGWFVGGSVDRVLFGTTRLEGSLELVTHSRDTGHFAAEGDTTIVGLSLVHRFGRQTVQPYVLGGVTIGHHSGKSSFDDLRFTASSTDLGLRFGAGVAVVVNTRFEVSPEFRMNGFFIDNDSNPWMVPSFGVRVGYRF
jgi:outer membrane protein with beta-barrel domain